MFAKNCVFSRSMWVSCALDRASCACSSNSARRARDFMNADVQQITLAISKK
jgi:hypothetical protein